MWLLKGLHPDYNVEHFTYNKQEDHYICPQNQILKTTGKKHKAATYFFKRYTTTLYKRRQAIVEHPFGTIKRQ